MTPETQEHSLEQVWVNIRKTQTQTAGLEAKMDTVIDGMGALNTTISTIQNKPESKVNLIGIGTLIIGLALVIGSYSQARFAPVESIIEKHDTQIMKELEASADHRYKSGVRDGKLQAMEVVMHEFIMDINERVGCLEKKAASSESTMEYAVRHIYSVDERGNRGCKLGEAQ